MACTASPMSHTRGWPYSGFSGVRERTSLRQLLEGLVATRGVYMCKGAPRTSSTVSRLCHISSSKECLADCGLTVGLTNF